MYSVGAAEILGGISIVWLLLLTYLFFKERGYLRTLFPKSESKDIRQKFKELIEIINDFDKKMGIFNNRLVEYKKEGLYNISRLEISRYNPYNDTGGDQSFSVVMLDGRMHGVILSSLHSRAGTRVYIKNIKNGKSEMELSKEERQVLEKALND